MSKSIDFPVLVADSWKDYELIDAGDGFKFERYGKYKFIRPDSQSYWKPRQAHENWKADATFSGRDGDELGRWNFRQNVPEKWEMQWQGLKFYARCTPFRHLGFFPEQAVHWSYCEDKIKAAVKAGNPQPKVLNLFGYTGLASLVCARAGAQVTHIDASKKSVTFARENQSLAGLEDAHIRWIVEDAIKFVEREIRRGNKYDGIILDPPKHGRGPNGEVFKLEEKLYQLLADCAQLLTPNPLFMVATVYAVRLSFVALLNTMEDALVATGQNVNKDLLHGGEMVLPFTASAENDTERNLPTAIFARFGKL